MNKSEEKGYRWLLKQGYKEKDIVYQRRGIDFLCSDGKKYEVKRVYGSMIWFHSEQLKEIRDERECVVLVIRDEKEDPVTIIPSERLENGAIIEGIKIVDIGERREKPRGNIVRVRNNGRVTIPPTLLNEKGIADGDFVLLSIEKIRIEIEK